MREASGCAAGLGASLSHSPQCPIPERVEMDRRKDRWKDRRKNKWTAGKKDTGVGERERARGEGGGRSRGGGREKGEGAGRGKSRYRRKGEESRMGRKGDGPSHAL